MAPIKSKYGKYLFEEQFVEKDAIGPPVHGPGVALALEDLRCHELGRPAERRGRAVRQVQSVLGQPVVCQLDVAVGVQEDVVELEVPVDDALQV